MMKRTMTAAALAAMLVAPAFAQSTPSMNPSPPSSSPAVQAQSVPQKGAFVHSQSSSEWRTSKLIGLAVYGADDKKIGDIEELLVDNSGAIRAAVIGVGGFLVVGEKDVAVSFSALNIHRKANSDAIDKVTVSYNKDELKNAPKFTWYQANGSRQTTGAAPSVPPATRTAPGNDQPPASGSK